MSVRNPRRDWALRLAGRGWPVIPLVPRDKKPAIEQWERHATTDPDRITAFWTRHPDHNVGIACGPAGLVVVDLDVAKPGQMPPENGCITPGVVHGAQTLARLTAQAGAPMPDTWTVRTPSCGTHLYYRQPAGMRLPNSRGRLGWLIDTRGWGGQVVAPGSITPAGDYELVLDLDPPELPGWLVQALTERPPTAHSAPHQMATTNVSAWVAAALEGEAHRIATAPPGGHNAAHLAAGRALGELVGAEELDYHTALRVMQHAAQAQRARQDCDCTERATTAVFVSALNYGMRRPRRITTRGRRPNVA